MSISIPYKSAVKTKFWIVCCEKTEATERISQAVAQWQLPGVRSLLSDQVPLSEAETIAQSDYAIFVTQCPQPCSQIKVSPLSVSSQQSTELHLPQGPVALLSAAHSRHGQSPQAWWFQLPTTEVRAQHVRPISTEKTVAQALNQIEIFVRNYRLAVAPRTTDSHETTTAKQLVTAQGR